jgi:hypothetical protein
LNIKIWAGVYPAHIFCCSQPFLHSLACCSVYQPPSQGKDFLRSARASLPVFLLAPSGNPAGIFMVAGKLERARRLRKEVNNMTESKTVKCTECNQPMESVELHDVPGDDIRNFIDIPGNRLDDNWYWCPKCDTYKQETPPIRLSPDIKRITQLLDSISNNW